jgi:isoquinoline 1-oxidoreductase beta subunit
MSGVVNVSRREFLMAGAAFGGSFVLGFPLTAGKPGQPGSLPASKSFMPNAFIRIAQDDTVTIIVNKSEMGQGVYTSLPMIVGEELDADWSTIRVESAPVNPAYNHTEWGIQGTGGSTSVRTSWKQLATAGATARAMLVAAAAKAWKVDPSTCRTEKGFVIHEPSAKKLSYGQLVKDAAYMMPPENVSRKNPQSYNLIGRPVPRLDTPQKTNGKAVFGIDVALPGMLTALVARSPVFGGKVNGFNAEKAKAIPGVMAVVEIASGVAVVADTFWSARKGREALDIVWDEGPQAKLDSNEQRQQYETLAKKPGVVAFQRGDVEQAMTKGEKKVEAAYEGPYLAHAPMEPLNCVVDLRHDSCDIWTGTQMQTTDRNAAATILGLPPEKVNLHTMLLGGGFGRRAVGDSHFVKEAAQVARAIQRPVKILWTREDDIRGGYYRPAVYSLLKGSVDTKGMPVAWKQSIVSQSILKGTPFGADMKSDLDPTQVEGAADSPYEIPHVLVDYHMAPAGVPVLWWRSVGHSFTAFAKEGFIDELAHAAGADPYRYRRQLLAKHPRQRAALDMVAEKSGWGKLSVPGRYKGIAVHESFGSIVAQVAEVSADKAGRVRVHKVVCTIDCGRIVNPDTIAAQMESGIAFGLSAALYGKITFKDGRVEQGNFHDYPMLRIDEMPLVEVHIVPSKEEPGGVGEPGVPPIAPAVVNAIFAATGKRIRRLPINLADPGRR